MCRWQSDSFFFFFPPEIPICFPYLLPLPSHVQWTAWILPARDEACACEENVTVQLAGEEQIVRPQELLAWTNALVTGPSSQIPDSAAAIPTGLDTIAQSVTSAVTYCWFLFYLNFVKYSDLDLQKRVLQLRSSKARVGHDWKQKCHSSTT